jgi:hypothetical protein
VSFKKPWTKPVIRRLDIDEPSDLTPQQRQAVELLKLKAREGVAADG